MTTAEDLDDMALLGLDDESPVTNAEALADAVAEVRAKQDEDKPTSVADWFKKSVTLPRDTVTIFTDAQAAFDYMRLADNESDITRRVGVLRSLQSAWRKDHEQGQVDITETVPYVDDIQDLLDQQEAEREHKTLVFTEMEKSAVKVEMRALYPAESRLLNRSAQRYAKSLAEREHGGGTPSDEDEALAIARYTNALYLNKSVVSMIAGDESLDLPSPEEWLQIENTLSTQEYSRLIDKMSELNTRAAIRDARTDAGFPG